MGLVKVVVKVLVVLFVVAAIAGIVALVKKPTDGAVSFEHWPDVARKTAA
jgi:hypothetical protein